MAIITQKLSYGMYVVSSVADGKPCGCIANCAVQITAEPETFAVSINHDNYTHGAIKKSGKFALSVLSVDSSPDIIRTFGFKSGKNTDKFASAQYSTVGGLPIITDSCGYIVCDVIDTMETPTHTVFLGKLVASELFNDAEPMTYDYYHKVIKGSSPKNAPTYVSPKAAASKPVEKPKRKFVCAICGYVYEGEDLPDDLVCPICGVGAEMFAEIK